MIFTNWIPSLRCIEPCELKKSQPVWGGGTIVEQKDFTILVSHASEVPAFPKKDQRNRQLTDGSGEAAAKFSRRRKQKISGEKGLSLQLTGKIPLNNKDNIKQFTWIYPVYSL
jgi:hypothetical protein